MKVVERLYKRQVMSDVDNGMTCEEIVKKYPVSMYYARLWSGEVYHKKDVSHYVRDRYKWQVLEACGDIENEVMQKFGDKVVLPAEALDECFDFIRKRIYRTLEEVVKKN
jgi:hypothetical protein